MKKSRRAQIRQIAKAITKDPNVINEAMVPNDGGNTGGHEDYEDSRQDPFISFLNAVIGSAPHGKVDAVLNNLLNHDSDSIRQMMTQIESIGKPTALRDYILAKPSNIRKLLDIAKKIYSEEMCWDIIDKINLTKNSDEKEGEEGDFYYDQGEDSDGH